jgi:hypothetical protein
LDGENAQQPVMMGMLPGMKVKWVNNYKIYIH